MERLVLLGCPWHEPMRGRWTRPIIAVATPPVVGRLSLDTRAQTAHSAIATAPSTFNDLTIAFPPRFLLLSKVMRLLAEILVIALLIFFGWNKPFKDQVARAKATITSTLDGMGGTLQKHQDKSVKRY